ncbi:hypothetical protein PDE_04287 [Penicillium oxalicum 114-2]|uniref:Uncharacterized protein n=1 Tax=Penicillium oxalicum (strain 114-2 / CGMCC 5302) TaxID=933388 RepID=S8ATC5_PENO1|nr:hypothetical protein PDE_04287 [Penicillium oxalicum 114-2]
MDVLPPPGYSPVQPGENVQIPTQTPPVTLEKSHASCVSGDAQKFREIIDSQSSLEDFDICEFYTIMIQAVKLDGQLIKQLLDRGLHIDSLYALRAIREKWKDALEVSIQNGWTVNQPISEPKPPVLEGDPSQSGIDSSLCHQVTVITLPFFRYAFPDEEMVPPA